MRMDVETPNADVDDISGSNKKKITMTTTATAAAATVMVTTKKTAISDFVSIASNISFRWSRKRERREKARHFQAYESEK